MKKRVLFPFIALFLAMVALCSPGAGGTASAHTQRMQTPSALALPAVASLPGQVLDTSVYVWGTNVNARYSAPLFPSNSCHYFPSTSCQIEYHFTQQPVPDICQQQGETVTAEGITNNWWSLIDGPDSTPVWVSNIYIQGGQTIDGVPDCNF